MKILHTADLHLGRHLGGLSLYDDHAAVLEQILAAVDLHAPDLLIIAGDIFDRAAPPERAVAQFNAFLREMVMRDRMAIAMIAGNHDSGERIEAMSMLADQGRALVRGALKADESALVLHDEAGPVYVSALPFAYEYAARECFGKPDIKAPADVLRNQVASARAHVPHGARWIVVAHAFVEGATATVTERPLTRAVGGIETVPANVFEGASYVALGHLHRAQAVGASHIRYSGSPLAYGFDEVGQEKSLVLVDLGADGHVSSEYIPIRPLRQVRIVRGSLDELLADEAAPPSYDFIQIELTDRNRRIDPMKRLRKRFPNACGLSYPELERNVSPVTTAMSTGVLDRPAELVGSFLDFARGSGPSEAEAAILEAGITKFSAASEGELS